MRYSTQTVYVPNTARLQADSEIGNIKYGNMMNSMAQAKMHDEESARINAKYPQAGHYIEKLSIFHRGKRADQNASHIRPFKDGYDTYRMPINIGYRLNNITKDVPSAYEFTEGGHTLFLGHFKHNKPANNSKGFQALYFNDAGTITQFAVVNEKEHVKLYALDEELPASVIPVLQNVKDVTAPSRKDVLQTLSDADDDLAKYFARDLAKECAPA